MKTHYNNIHHRKVLKFLSFFLTAAINKSTLMKKSRALLLTYLQFQILVFWVLEKIKVSWIPCYFQSPCNVRQAHSL